AAPRWFARAGDYWGPLAESSQPSRSAVTAPQPSAAGCARGEPGGAATGAEFDNPDSREARGSSMCARAASPSRRGGAGVPVSATVSFPGCTSNRNPAPKKAPIIAAATSPIRTRYNKPPTGSAAKVVGARFGTGSGGDDGSPRREFSVPERGSEERPALRKPSSGSALPGRSRTSSHGPANISSRIIASFALYSVA